jgi:hypothetical protein
MAGWNHVHIGPDGRTSLARHELYTEIGAALYERANTTWLLGGADPDYHMGAEAHALGYLPPWAHGDPDPSVEPIARDPIDIIYKYRNYLDRELFVEYYTNLGYKEATPPLLYVQGTAAAGEINLFEDAGLPAWITVVTDISTWEVGDTVQLNHAPVLWTGTIVAVIPPLAIQVRFAPGSTPAIVNANAAYGVWNATKFLHVGIVTCSECGWTVAGPDPGPGGWTVDRSLFTDFEAVCNALIFFRCPCVSFDGDPIAKPIYDVYLGHLWIGPSETGVPAAVQYNNPGATRFVVYFQAKFTGSAGGSLVVSMSPDFNAEETPPGDSATWETLATIPNPDDGLFHWYKAETTNADLWRGQNPAIDYQEVVLRLDASSRSAGDDIAVADGHGFFEFNWAYHA